MNDALWLAHALIATNEMWRHVCNVPIKPGTLQTCHHILLLLLR